MTEHSEVYALNEIRSRTGTGKMVQNLVPCVELKYRLPIRINRLSLREIPLCHECCAEGGAEAAMAHLPDGRAEREWALALRAREARERREAEREAADAVGTKTKKAVAPLTARQVLDIL
jgi:hypothetical protein